MANRDIVNGLVPVGTFSGTDYRGYLTEVEFASGDSTAAFLGDLVKETSTASADGKRKVVTQAAAGDNPLGVIVGFKPDFENESFNTLYRAASTERIAYVAAGNDVLYEIQEDSVGAALTVAQVGLNANVIVGSGDTITGVSGMELDSSTANTTATLRLRIHGLADKPGNAVGDNAVWLVSLNTNQVSTTTGV